MQKPSDEELVNIVMKLGLDGCRDFTSDELKLKLLTRLERGRKAIEFANALIKHRNNGVDLESNGRIYNWLDEYEGQINKEATDENIKD